MISNVHCFAFQERIVSMYRWCARHGTLIIVFATAPLAVILLICISQFGIPIWFALLFIFVMSVISSMFVNSCAKYLLLKAGKVLSEQCDPFALLKETEDQLSYSLSKKYNQILLIDHCVSLRYIGEYEKVFAQLKAINIDRYKKTSPVIKLIYYINLTDIHLCLNEIADAEMFQSKSLQLLQAIKNDKIKTIYLKTVNLNAAEILYFKQEYDGAADILSKVYCESLSTKVSKALLFAKIYIAQDKINEARSELQFVVENGNKMIDVQIARQLLSKIQTGIDF